jgi:hypothetical protein
VCVRAREGEGESLRVGLDEVEWKKEDASTLEM